MSKLYLVGSIQEWGRTLAQGTSSAGWREGRRGCRPAVRPDARSTRGMATCMLG